MYLNCTPVFEYACMFPYTFIYFNINVYEYKFKSIEHINTKNEAQCKRWGGGDLSYRSVSLTNVPLWVVGGTLMMGEAVRMCRGWGWVSGKSLCLPLNYAGNLLAQGSLFNIL